MTMGRYILKLFLLFLSLAAQGAECMPVGGVIPDKVTAGKVAYIILSKIYGADVIDKQLPFEVGEEDGIWVVSGVLRGKYVVGGVATIEISKNHGRVISVAHGK